MQADDQALLINYRLQGLSLSLSPSQVYSAYTFFFYPSLSLQMGKCSETFSTGENLIPFIVCEQLMTSTRSVSWLLASSQCVCFLDGLSSGKSNWTMGGARRRTTGFTSQTNSARFHLTWIWVRSMHAMEYLCGSWHFNDSISLGRIFLWVVSSVILSTEWSCYIMMNLHYLLWLCCIRTHFSPRP
jgi:hypothetical protein